jgi:hypothetical protein
MIVRALLSVLFFSIAILSGMAQTIIESNDTVDEQNFMPYRLQFYVDSANRLSFDQIVSSRFSDQFRVHPDYQNKDFIAEAAYWIRVPVKIRRGTKKIWLLEFYDQTIDHIDAYIPQQDGTYKHESMGDRAAFSNRLFQHKNFEILVKPHSDSLAYYYFKVRSHEFADMRIAFRSANRFVYYAISEYFLYGTFYGMVLIISLYNLLMYLAIREIKNIYYIFYILSVALYAMSLDGIGFQYIWYDYPQWNDIATGVGLYLLIFWSLVFTRRFLSTKTNSRVLDKALLWMILVRSGLFVYALIFNRQLFAFRYLEIIPISLIFYSGVNVWYGGYRPARFFVIAYGSLLMGFLLRTLVYFNVFTFTTILHYSLHISFVFEMLFLTFALGDRIRILKDNRDRALRRIINQHEVNMMLKDKVNRELEEKVTQRTQQLNQKNHELEESNAKLGQQALEINQINSVLDRDNWKLKGKIKEVLNDQILEKTMDYGQFRELYPDTLSCYRFLENLKWSNAFECRKCGNQKFFTGSQKFSRRCTRCGYNESITAYTIFHSIKFPIERAFYIAFLVVAGKKDSTLEALASQLNIRINTVWAFKHKVLGRIGELEKRGKRPTISRWEEVILTPHHSVHKRSGSDRPKIYEN